MACCQQANYIIQLYLFIQGRFTYHTSTNHHMNCTRMILVCIAYNSTFKIDTVISFEKSIHFYQSTYSHRSILPFVLNTMRSSNLRVGHEEGLRVALVRTDVILQQISCSRLIQTFKNESNCSLWTRSHTQLRCRILKNGIVYVISTTFNNNL